MALPLTGRRGVSLALGAGLATLGAGPAFAIADKAMREARWKALDALLFGKTALRDGAGMLALDAPFRAQDAALVPMGLTVAPAAAPSVLMLVIDLNPSPVAAKVAYGPAGDPHLFRARVRVNDYTWVHAVAETADGIFLVRKYVRAAGGCSAPSVGDPATASRDIGEMKLRLARAPLANGAREATLLIRHPNNNGMQMDQLTHYIIPPRFITTIAVHLGGERVFAMETGISLAEDPAITFAFHPRRGAALEAVVHDTSGAVFRKRFALPSLAS